MMLTIQSRLRATRSCLFIFLTVFLLSKANAMSSAKRHRATKIVATLGSVSSDAETLRTLFDAGADVFRLNFSHGTQAEQGERVRLIRKMEDAAGRPTCIIADLQGPKHRIGVVADGTELAAGQNITFDMSDVPGNASRIGLPHPDIFAALTPGVRLLIDDGRLTVKVTKLHNDSFEAEVIFGGQISSRKGVNLPDLVLDSKPLTEKDLSDLEFALRQGVDWVALSFVQRASDLIEAPSSLISYLPPMVSW
jgi:pyruvate kinase